MISIRRSSNICTVSVPHTDNLVDVTDYLINYCEEAEKEGCTFKLDEDNMVVLLLGLIRGLYVDPLDTRR